MTPEEEDELFVRVAEAKRLNDAASPYFVDAVAEVVRWFEDLRIRRYERALEAEARRVRELVALLRATEVA